jgi:hypothetical protein
LLIFCLNLRKKGWKTQTKAIPYTTLLESTLGEFPQKHIYPVVPHDSLTRRGEVGLELYSTSILENFYTIFTDFAVYHVLQNHLCYLFFLQDIK